MNIELVNNGMLIQGKHQLFYDIEEPQPNPPSPEDQPEQNPNEDPPSE